LKKAITKAKQKEAPACVEVPGDILYSPVCRWVWSKCPVCGRGYPHSEYYKPATCLKKECILEWRRRQTLDSDLI
jgi:hypothetical protein